MYVQAKALTRMQKVQSSQCDWVYHPGCVIGQWGTGCDVTGKQDAVKGTFSKRNREMIGKVAQSEYK